MSRLLLLLGFVPAVFAAAPDFTRDIAPLLNTHCAACHAGKTRSSDFSVETLQAVIAGGKNHGKAVIGGHPELSPLVKMLKCEMAPRMPFGGALAAADIGRIENWIRKTSCCGAPTAGGWRRKRSVTACCTSAGA
ncbi:MAG: hypothetical protein LC126_03910 [Bryobacterales bacterium]|nr:hypothetical protein [Bryobacterales bacterium]